MQESVSGETNKTDHLEPGDLGSDWKNIAIPHPEKIIFPELGLRRLEIVAYYDEVSPIMLPHLEGRALTLTRWPQGIEGPQFYQRHPTPNAPLLISNRADLLRWVGRGAVEFHAPLGLWTNPLSHDWAVLDLDPSPELPWANVREASEIVGEFLRLCGIAYGLKTSGKRGVHFFIRIKPTDQRRTVYWMRCLATLLSESFPDLFSVERLKIRRGTRIYLDYLQNSGARSMAAIFSLRATPTASVSTPVTLEGLQHPPEYWTPARILGRWAHLDEIWQGCAELVDLGRIMHERKLLRPDAGF